MLLHYFIPRAAKHYLISAKPQFLDEVATREKLLSPSFRNKNRPDDFVIPLPIDTILSRKSICFP